MKSSPLAEQIVFSLGPVPISQPVVTTWVIMLALCLVCWLGLRGRATRGGALQTMLEVIVVALATQVEDVIKREPWPYLPLLGSLFVFLVVANLCAVIPGVSPPTAHIETPAALALIVFVSVHYFGVRA
ncbi:MAG: F0F1 ATP synthase subunit A, partial [Gammaproteobacteria bacterium]|nr:F0F1 ATP synthase subunit A [Gammaproteobacteria bacterium]